MVFWSWLDIPLAVLVLAGARAIPLWLDRRRTAATVGLGTTAAAYGRSIRLDPDAGGLAESDERLAGPDCLADRFDLQDWAMPQLTPCPQCGLPAEIRERFWLQSTDGPIDHAALSCIEGHHFRMAADGLLPAAPLARARKFDPVGPGSRSVPPMTW
jgi:hypothetical protein